MELTKEDVAYLEGCIGNFQKFVDLFKDGTTTSGYFLYDLIEAMDQTSRALGDYRMDLEVAYVNLPDNDEDEE